MPLIIDEGSNVVQIQEADKIVLAEPEVTVVIVEAGTPGVKGDKGDTGTPVQFQVSTPSNTWTIVHNLNRYPASWQVYDTADTPYQVGAEYLDANTMRFTFSAPISGRVLLY